VCVQVRNLPVIASAPARCTEVSFLMNPTEPLLLPPAFFRPATYHIPRTGLRRSAQRPTALEALGARVPADGPRADVVAIAPWEVPNWEERLNDMGVVRPQDRKA
jgi:hypothetical protein